MNRPKSSLVGRSMIRVAALLALVGCQSLSPTLAMTRQAINQKLRRIEIRDGSGAPTSVQVGDGVALVTINPADNVPQRQLGDFIESEVTKHL